MGLKNYQINRILREYDSRQLRSRRELEERRIEIYAAIPEIEAIDRRLASGSIALARQLLNADTPLQPSAISASATEGLAEDNRRLSAEKQHLLSSHGYPPDYLDPRYQCPDCRDTGYIGVRKCHCFRQAMVDLLYGQSGLAATLKEENFIHFSLDYYSDSYVEESTGLTPRACAAKARKTADAFVEAFDSSYQNLFLYGNTGVGKTFLANCVAKELLDRSHTVIYLTAFQLFDALEKYTFRREEEGEDPDSELGYILGCDLLILDDLGTELTNSFVTSRLYLCLNERHLRRKSTLISTNLSLDDLHRNYSERIFSRITSHYIMVKLVGEDIRIQKAFSSAP